MRETVATIRGTPRDACRWEGMMRKSTRDLEPFRLTDVGQYSSDASFGFNGVFRIPHPNGVMLQVMASDGSEWPYEYPAWEHVSVSLGRRCPTWDEMDYVKRLFWRDDELVIQMHVPRNNHVNNHPYCLHLWKPVGVEIPVPPTHTVGVL